MLRLILMVCLCAGALYSPKSIVAQTEIDWHTLSHVTFAHPDPSHRGPEYGKPNFGLEVKKLAGQSVVIDGYMLPLTVDNKLYVLSKYPFTECFFCGGAGKETVIELKLKREMKFDLDEPVKIKGRLKLVEDPIQLSYVLEEAMRVD